MSVIRAYQDGQILPRFWASSPRLPACCSRFQAITKRKRRSISLSWSYKTKFLSAGLQASPFPTAVGLICSSNPCSPSLAIVSQKAKGIGEHKNMNIIRRNEVEWIVDLFRTSLPEVWFCPLFVLRGSQLCYKKETGKKKSGIIIRKHKENQ